MQALPSVRPEWAHLLAWLRTTAAPQCRVQVGVQWAHMYPVHTLTDHHLAELVAVARQYGYEPPEPVSPTP